MSSSTTKDPGASPAPTTGDELSALYTMMSRIRAFEERVGQHFRDGDVHGFVHVSIGQEAVAVGVCAALDDEDVITTTHRGHGHCLAKGADAMGMFAELFGRDTGLCRGKGGSMHISDPRIGILGANGIVGAGIPLAVGAALSSRVRHRESVAVAFFGEGAVHCGAFHESATLAVAMALPIVFLCEDNGYAEFTPSGHWGGPSPATRGESYGMGAERVDGNDVVAVLETAKGVVAHCRSGGGPIFVEARTNRIHGHYEGDAQQYRTSDECNAGDDRDPLVVARRRMADPAEADAIDLAVEAEMDAAVETALAAPYPSLETVLEDVYA